MAVHNKFVNYYTAQLLPSLHCRKRDLYDGCFFKLVHSDDDKFCSRSNIIGHIHFHEVSKGVLYTASSYLCSSVLERCGDRQLW